MKVSVETPQPNLSAGLGCQAACIEKALLTNDGERARARAFEMRTAVPATMSLSLVVKTISGKTLHFFQHVTGSKKTEHTATFDRLLTGATYHVTAKATDAEGRTRVEEGTFRTRSAVAVVTFHKITVINDADKGSNAGEISFDYRAGDDTVGGHGFHRIDSGETVAARAYGAGRPGVMITQSIDRQRTLALEVGGQRVRHDPEELRHRVRDGGAISTRLAKLELDVRDAMGGGATPARPGHGSPAVATMPTRSGRRPTTT